jgi:hypothetical protein
MGVIESNPIPGSLGLYHGAGAPTDDQTFKGVAPVGAQYVDTASGIQYTCTVSTATNITWVKIGLQT